MRVGRGFAYKDSRVTRTFLTPGNGTLGQLVDVSPDGYSNTQIKQSVLGGSAIDQAIFAAGCSAEFFPPDYEYLEPVGTTNTIAAAPGVLPLTFATKAYATDQVAGTVLLGVPSTATIVTLAVEYASQASGANTVAITITGGSQTFTAHPSGRALSSAGGTARVAQLYYLVNPLPGPMTIVATVSGGVGAAAIAMTATSWANVDTGTPFGTPVLAISASTNAPSAAPAGGSVILAVGSFRTATAVTVGGSQVTFQNTVSGTGVNLFGVVTYQPAGGTATFSWTTASESAIFAIALNAIAPPTAIIAVDPVRSAYSTLVSPAVFAPPNHFYRSGGMAAAQNFKTSTDHSPVRYDDAYRGLYAVDDSDKPWSSSDVLGLREGRPQIYDPRLPAKQNGSAFHSVQYTTGVANGGGVVFRSKTLRHGNLTGPYYVSFFFKTTWNSFNFFGGYQEYQMATAYFNPLDRWVISLVNDTQTISGVKGYLSISYNAFGVVAGQRRDTTVLVNDGNWHHCYLWVDNTGSPTLWIDGKTQITPSAGGPALVTLANTLQISSNFIDGFSGDVYGLACGDANGQTLEDLYFLAAGRTLPDRTVALTGSGQTLQYADSGVFHYESTTATWNKANSKMNVYDGSNWIAQPKLYDTANAVWRKT